MKISLTEFLKTGRIGGLPFSTSEDVVRQVLGAPEPRDEGSVNRKPKRLSILKYGCIGLVISRPPKSSLMLIQVEQDIGAPRFFFPTDWEVVDWELSPGASRKVVQKYLDKIGLAYEFSNALGPELLIVPPKDNSEHNVSLTFDEGGRLQAIMSGLAAQPR
jgi:hypothetical protein